MTAEKKYKRAWVDGCFDMMHFGHANALRQAKELADEIVVGVHSDEEILKNKGPPVMKEDERYAAVRACKWVDLVVPNAPYLTSLEMLDKYNCEVCIHGDDLTLAADGTDCYQKVKDACRFVEVKRTVGVSTTELIGRMLSLSKEHLLRDVYASHMTNDLESVKSPLKVSPYTNGDIRFFPTTKRLLEFSNPKEPNIGDRVVYVDGTFDFFHAGHAEFLKLAKAQGDYLLVGIHDDQTVNKIKGFNYPLMNLHERALSVLSCRYVDEVIIGAPFTVTKGLLEKIYKVDIVVHGNTPVFSPDGQDPYELPKSLNIYKEIDTSFSWLSIDVIIQRILNQQKIFEHRNREKNLRELHHIKN